MISSDYSNYDFFRLFKLQLSAKCRRWPAPFRPIDAISCAYIFPLQVKELNENIFAHEKEQKLLVDEMLKKQKKIDARKKAQNTVEAKLQKNIDQLEDEYQFVHRIAEEFDLDIEDFQRKIEEW